MSYLKIAVGHTDFEFEAIRSSFINGLNAAWDSVMEAEELKVDSPLIRSSPDAVDVYVAYGSEIDGVRNAERAAAAMMASICYGVMVTNRDKTNPVLAVYQFTVERDVSLEEDDPAPQETPVQPAEAISPQS